MLRHCLYRLAYAVVYIAFGVMLGIACFGNPPQDAAFEVRAEQRSSAARP